MASTSDEFRARVSKFGWEILDEFGTDLQLEMFESDGRTIHVRVCDYLERKFTEAERTHLEQMVNDWLSENDGCKAQIADEPFEFEFEITVQER